ncbi:MAG: HdeD family acid-resistance protein [Acidimicrobiales bacterium]
MLVTNPLDPAYDLDRSTRGWGLLALSGLLSIVAGGIILFTDWTLADLVTFVGAVLVFRGIVNTFNVPLDGSGRGWSVFAGLLEVALGLMVWVWPSPTLLVLSFWLGWYIMFSGISAIAGALTGRDALPFWGFMLAFGIIEVLLSLWLLARPGLSLVVAVVAVGVWSIAYGAVQIAIAFDIKRMRDGASSTGADLRDRPRSRDVQHSAA